MGKIKYILVPAASFFVAAAGAFALHSPEHYSLFGEASYISPGNASNRAVHLVSDADPGFAGISYGVEGGLTFADIEALGTDYRFESDDSCGGGSPRFQVAVESPDGADAGITNIFLSFFSKIR